MGKRKKQGTVLMFAVIEEGVKTRVGRVYPEGQKGGSGGLLCLEMR